MKDYLNLKDLKEITKKKIKRRWLDKLNFIHILGIWISIIIAFGVIYYLSRNNISYLFNTLESNTITEIKDFIYFSFVAATTTGFGDIVPIGQFRIIAIFEVICGILLLAIVTSKLVSIKQDAILSELYELSFNEKINGLRSSLLLFRQNLESIKSKIEDGFVKKRDLSSVYVFLSSFEDTLMETHNIINKSGNNRFLKNIDPMKTELIFNSILSSFEKIHDLIIHINNNKLEWKSEITLGYLEKCMSLNEELFDRINISTSLRKETLHDLNTKKDKVINSIKDEITRKDKTTKVQNL